MATAQLDRLTRLLGFLEADPDNVGLIADAAEAAYEAAQLDQAETLLMRLNQLGAATEHMRNLAGLIAMRLGHYHEAISIFEELAREHPADGPLRFNLAWASTLAGRYQEALDWLDAEAISASPHAPRLKVQVLHHLGRLEDALAFGESSAAKRGMDPTLSAALALVALDAEQLDIARSYALAAGDQPDGLAARGMIALAVEQDGDAEAAFQQALAAQPDNARAWIGQGIIALQRQDAAAAAEAIARGATIFGSHVGSWVAAGWAQFLAGDDKAARRSFEQALVANSSFSEPHGGLAVLDITTNDVKGAREKMKTALRLDPDSFGGRLAQILLLEQAGDVDRAATIRQMALTMPVGPGGSTILQKLVSLQRRR